MGRTAHTTQGYGHEVGDVQEERDQGHSEPATQTHNSPSLDRRPSLISGADVPPRRLERSQERTRSRSRRFLDPMTERGGSGRYAHPLRT
jgi:hypothetical protein